MPRPEYYTAAAVRELDRLAINQAGIPGFTLMERAGQAAFDTLRQHWPATRRLEIFCGTGNNGGDGFIVAGLARAAGLEVNIWLADDEQKIQGDARRALEYAREWQVPILPAAELRSSLPAAEQDIIVDALLGTGLQGEVREPYRGLIELINDSPLPVLALDIPSGLCSDTGGVLGAAVRAEATITFIGRKIGQVCGEGPDYCGAMYFHDLEVPAQIYAQVSSTPPLP